MRAYYNEWDPYCAQWLRNLVAAGLIPAGVVDERDIRDVRATDLAGYRQCHFFAGIAGWSQALRLAGWPDDREVWTGSCPCQPFSNAGKQRGTSDERHLWPEFHRLIAERRPSVVFGEQVAGRLGREWLAAVQVDMEALDHAFGAADLCSAGVGAPNIRQRLWWVAYARRIGNELGSGLGHAYGGPLANSNRNGCRASGTLGGQPQECDPEPRSRLGDSQAGQQRVRQPKSGDEQPGPIGRSGSFERLGNADSTGLEIVDRQFRDDVAERSSSQRTGAEPWSDIEWLPCRDGKARPTQPGLFPLAHGVPNRVGRLRAYGGAINPYTAEKFISAFMSVADQPPNDTVNEVSQ